MRKPRAWRIIVFGSMPMSDNKPSSSELAEVNPLVGRTNIWIQIMKGKSQ
jgi:hypothetical protein